MANEDEDEAEEQPGQAEIGFEDAVDELEQAVEDWRREHDPESDR